MAPPPVLEKINLGKQEADLCTSTLSQLMVQAYFEQGDWRDYVDSLTEIYRARRDAMLDALAEHFPPQAEWTRPGGGLFIWATLPDFIDTTDLLARALRDNVAFVPGAGGVPRRPRPQLDAAELLRLRRGAASARASAASARSSRSRWRCTARSPARRPPSAPSELAVARRRTTRGRRAWSSCRDAAPRGGGPGAREPRRGAQGRALAGAPGVAALRRPRRGRARAPRPRGGRASTWAST